MNRSSVLAPVLTNLKSPVLDHVVLSHCSGCIIIRVVSVSCVDISSWPIWGVLANTISCAIDFYGCQIRVDRQLSVHLILIHKAWWNFEGDSDSGDKFISYLVLSDWNKYSWNLSKSA